MEPLKIEIQIGLQEETITAVKQLLLASITSFMELCNAAQGKSSEEAAAPAQEAPQEARTATVEQVPAEPVGAAPAAPADDMPDFSNETYTDDQLAEATRKAVAGVKAQGKSASIIRTSVFAKYNISESAKCPAHLRGALYADLKALWKED